MKPYLLFLFDEGFKGDALARCKYDDRKLNLYLRNFTEAMEGLEEKFRPVMLLYPNQFYDAHAYGKKNPTALDRVHPALRRIMAYFEKRIEEGKPAIQVFIEMYSSGVMTSQNGELGLLDPAPLHMGEEGQDALPMDLDAAAALKRKFPKAFGGIRFHEVYGSDLVIKVTGGHGFIPNPAVIRGLIDLCHQEKLVMYWSDSSWLMDTLYDKGTNYIRDEKYRAYMDVNPYAELQQYAMDQLGENIIFSYANNAFCLPVNLERLGAQVGETEERPVCQKKIGGVTEDTTVDGVQKLFRYLQFSQPGMEDHVHPLRKRYPHNWGISDQSWFWFEMLHVLSYKRYYPHSHDDCPIEIIAAYCQKALKDGTRGIQFEPNWYLFNTGNSNAFLPCGHEGEQDCSPRTNFLRLKEMLLHEDANIAHNPNEFFDDDMQRLLENDAVRPPKNYNQTTLYAFGTVGTPVSYAIDWYSNGKKWVSGQRFRLPASIQREDVRFAARAAMNGGGTDVLALGVQEKEGLTLKMIRVNGAALGINQKVLRAEDAHLHSLVCLNLLGQPGADQLLCIFEKEGKLLPKCFQMNWKANVPLNEALMLSEMPVPEDIEAFIAAASPKASFFSLRGDAVAYEDDSRLRDALCAAEESGKVSFARCALQSASIDAADGARLRNGQLAITAGDITLTGAEGLMLLVKRKGRFFWRCYAVNKEGLTLSEETEDASAYNFMDQEAVVCTRNTVLRRALRDANAKLPDRRDAFCIW